MKESRKRKDGKKRVAIIGSQGVPAAYGGFETLVENIIGENCSGDVEYTVYCSAPDMDTSLSDYKGARLRYVKLHAHGKQSIPYDIVSMIRSVRRHDVILVLGVSGGIFLPFLKLFTRKKIIVNIDGLEHRREKWSGIARKFLKHSLDLCVRWADEVVSDNRGIQDYVRETYGREARLIAYGGDHVLRDISEKRQQAILDFYGLKRGEYDLAICRIEPENNCGLTLDTYRKSGRQLVFIGNWDHSDYSRNLETQYKDLPNFRLLKSIYDIDILYVLRKNARCYVHGHRAGGTNPSLVEAMFFGRPILAFDVIYNRETTQNQAYYFSDGKELARLLERTDLRGDATYEVARREYIWSKIARRYEDLY